MKIKLWRTTEAELARAQGEYQTYTDKYLTETGHHLLCTKSQICTYYIYCQKTTHLLCTQYSKHSNLLSFWIEFLPKHNGRLIISLPTNKSLMDGYRTLLQKKSTHVIMATLFLTSSMQYYQNRILTYKTCIKRP